MQYATYREILNQPHSWQATLDSVQAQADAIQDLAPSDSNHPILLTGCGSPYYLTHAVATAYRTLTGQSAIAHPASNVWLFPESHLPASSKLLLTVSRSGATTEVLKAVETFKSKTKGNVIGVTCYPDTPLVPQLTLPIVLPDAQEQSLAQTQSLTSMLIASLSSVFALANQNPTSEFQQLPQSAQHLLDTYHDLAQSLGRDLSYERFFFLGSGSLYGIACEAMLKMKEMSLSYSEAYHFLEFRHGPMAMVNDKTLVVGLVSEQAMEHESDVLAEMRQMGATTLAITPSPLNSKSADYQVELPVSLSDIERLPLYLPVLQLIAYYRTVERGLNPDTPENLNAFVELKHIDSH